MIRQHKTDCPKIKAISLAIYTVISLAAPAVLIFICYWVYIFVMKTYTETAGVTLDRFFLQNFIVLFLIITAAIALLVCEIAGAVQVCRKNESRIPLIGKIANKILKM